MHASDGPRDTSRTMGVCKRRWPFRMQAASREMKQTGGRRDASTMSRFALFLCIFLVYGDFRGTAYSLPSGSSHLHRHFSIRNEERRSASTVIPAQKSVIIPQKCVKMLNAAVSWESAYLRCVRRRHKGKPTTVRRIEMCRAHTMRRQWAILRYMRMARSFIRQTAAFLPFAMSKRDRTKVIIWKNDDCLEEEQGRRDISRLSAIYSSRRQIAELIPEGSYVASIII